MAAERIIVADDDDLLREFLLRTLTKHGFHVLPAGDAPGVMEHLDRDAAQEIRALVTDHNIPGERGFDLARRLLATRPELKSVVISGDDLSGIVLPGEGIAFLQKPFELSQLVALVRGLLA